MLLAEISLAQKTKWWEIEESSKIKNFVKKRPFFFLFSTKMSLHRFQYVLNGSIRKLVPIFGVIFDLDGTLTVPVLNFAILRERLKPFKVSHGDDILASVEMRESLAEKKEMLRIIEEFEAEGRERFTLQPGVNEMLEIFHENKIKLAIMTRNNHKAVEQFLKHLKPRFQDGKIFSHVSMVLIQLLLIQ